MNSRRPAPLALVVARMMSTLLSFKRTLLLNENRATMNANIHPHITDNNATRFVQYVRLYRTLRTQHTLHTYGQRTYILVHPCTCCIIMLFSYKRNTK